MAENLSVWMALCSWTDSTLAACGRFYPRGTSKSDHKLTFYATRFPVVEVDMTLYQMPSQDKSDKWVKATPKNFLFHFKAFQMFCSKTCPYNMLPRNVREALDVGGGQSETSTVRWEDLSDNQKQQMWDRFNCGILPVYEAGKLGCVLFQFHIGFKPTAENKEWIKECRRSLLEKFDNMVVEFRDRSWIDEENLESTIAFCKENKLGLCCADELKDELRPGIENAQKTERIERGENSVVDVLPMVLQDTGVGYIYIRIHRREGKMRLLSPAELKAWSDRLRHLNETFKQRVYFNWGTAFEDQPMINEKNLAALIPDLYYNYTSTRKGNIMNAFLGGVQQGKKTEEKEIKSTESKRSRDSENGINNDVEPKQIKSATTSSPSSFSNRKTTTNAKAKGNKSNDKEKQGSLLAFFGNKT